ncbi:MAG: hypothetical protein A2271_00355 [Candidatus Moranbacteria bacterium RIFOXYA12_FULL_35_19]|nr:MAG: hypothetical protein UR78_C0004G0050 [Candidatus Moranbacteria bacterium GW2011_GWF2_35_39]OGI32849.1 MAG: hypothetical protein A2489_01915 [Candidatus Moranbacteria bacterium RIFOXYC12_FULL_36_13]OGI32860.1 MAG: hypothetical protein A2343_00515 [Candidatus Moranbacteria bacterium RIFOXYB12_FULL_35_8]OGI36177.1 MAG: hypothetical protein A2271_00355 [Candidatus Moranbacteria bacterium RIFOXYA12_FULL_35_19]
MKLVLKLIIQILANCVAILVADYLVSGFNFTGSWQDLVIAGAILGLVNSVIRPIVKLVAFPLIILTLGLFTIVINIALFIFAINFIPSLSVHGFSAIFWGIIVISLVNYIILSIFDNE